jgi:hypothetical protein
VTLRIYFLDALHSSSLFIRYYNYTQPLPSAPLLKVSSVFLQGEQYYEPCKHRHTLSICERQKYIPQFPIIDYALRLRSLLSTEKDEKELRTLVRERTLPTERPPLVREVSANFGG